MYCSGFHEHYTRFSGMARMCSILGLHEWLALAVGYRRSSRMASMSSIEGLVQGHHWTGYIRSSEVACSILGLEDWLTCAV